MEILEYAKLNREQRLAEKGTESPCPIKGCWKPRVKRTEYIRCNPCGLNWLSCEDLSLSPLLSREPYLTWKKKYAVAGSITGKTETGTSAESTNMDLKQATESGF